MRHTVKRIMYEPTSSSKFGLTYNMESVLEKLKLKSLAIFSASKESGAKINSFETEKSPHFFTDAEPETLSYQLGVVEEASVLTEVVIAGGGLPKMVAVSQGST